MSTQITTAMVETYNVGIQMLAQQMQHVLAGTVLSSSLPGKRNAFDQIGRVRPRKMTTRHADTDYTNTPHARRWVTTYTYDVADLKDPSDMIRILNDPGGAYTMAFLAGMNRERDKVLIDAMLGTAYYGEDGTSSIALPGAQQIAAGGTGFTLTKVQQAATKLFGKAVFAPGEELHIAWTRFQEDQFLNTTEVKSIDYNTQKVLVDGGMGEGKFYGFKYHRLEDFEDEESATVRILPYSASTRTCVAWVKSGVQENCPQVPAVKVAELPGKRYSTQYYGWCDFGAVRMEDVKVVQIDCVE